MQCAYAILSSVICPVLNYISILSHQGHDFREKKILNIKYVFLFPLQRLSETFLIVRRTERDVIKNVYLLTYSIVQSPS